MRIVGKHKKHVYLSEERMNRVVDRFVEGEKLTVLSALYGVSTGTISRASKRRGQPARVLVPNRCPHCEKKLTE